MWRGYVAGTNSSFIQVKDLAKLSFMSFPDILIRIFLYTKKCIGKWEHKVVFLIDSEWLKQGNLGRTHELHSWSWWEVSLLWIEMKNKGRRAGALSCHDYPLLLKTCRGFQSPLEKKVVHFSLESHIWSCTGLYLRENLKFWLLFFYEKDFFDWVKV